MIAVSNVTKSFGSIKAVNNINLTLHKGEIIGIVGPDGAGKSTLLRMAAGILQPDSGNLYFDGRPYDEDIYYVKEHIGYMPQRFGLYEDLMVLENIIFFGKIFGMRQKEIQKMLPVLWRFSNLEPFKDRLAGKLSGGMKQKLGLACCLVHKPKVLLLDEPTNGVDPVSRREFWRILYDLCVEGVTIMVSTAYLDEAERCNRVALMYNGSFFTVDTPANVKAMIGKPLIEIQSKNPVETEKMLRQHPQYSHAVRSGNAVRVFVDNVHRAKKEISMLCVKHHIGIISIREVIPSLEDTFVEAIAKAQ
jgi:ABC-2 type transport system ATP-binding protein